MFFAELALPELQYRLDECLVRTVMNLRILPVFVKGRGQGHVLGNQLVPRAFLNFRDLETPPALSLALPTKTLFPRDCHPESAPRRNTVRVRGPIPDPLKNLCEIPRRLTSRVLLLELLRNESIEMSFPKSDSPTEFHEFNLSITDPMAQRSLRNAEVCRC